MGTDSAAWPQRVLVAPDKFKGTLTAAEAAVSITAGVHENRPGAEVRTVAVADGGEGTVQAVLGAGGRPQVATVTGPLGEPVEAQWCLHEATGRDPAALDWGGAAGGTAAGLHAAVGARFEPGLEVAARLTGLADHLHWADLVIVGEGSLDEQSLQGKAPVAVAARARAAGVPVVAVAGRVSVSPEALAAAGISRHAAAADHAPTPADALGPQAAHWVRVAAVRVVRAPDHLEDGAPQLPASDRGSRDRHTGEAESLPGSSVRPAATFVCDALTSRTTPVYRVRNSIW